MKKTGKRRGKAKKQKTVLPRKKRFRSRRRTVKVGALSLTARARDAKLHNLKIADLFRPLKKPVTLRLDADVIAWFKKDGRKYQTRINQALRAVMQREMKR